MPTVDPMSDAPAELDDYFARSTRLADDDLAINPLTRDAASTYAAEIQQTSLGATLGLVPLEDADNSKPHCYITRGPAAGKIMQFNRGDAYSLRFPSLTAFVGALQDAKRAGIHIEEISPVQIPAVGDQAALSARLLAALERPPAEAESEIEALLPCLAATNTDVLTALSESDNFLIRECAAVFLERSPHISQEQIAQRLAKDTYSQVAMPAAAAAKKIRRMKWEQRGGA